MTRQRRSSLALLPVVVALALAACTPAAGEEAPPSAAEVSSTPSGAVRVVTDEEICGTYGDVVTIVENADAATQEGRMVEQEQQGWYRIASRTLDRIDTRGSGPVVAAVALMQDAVPAVAPGAAQPVDFHSDDATEANQAVIKACQDAGVEFAVEVFAGG